MKLMLWLGGCLILVVLSACGDDSASPTSEIEDCLRAAGAEVATEAPEMEFVVDNGFGVKADVGLDRSGTLGIGSYEGAGNGGWKVYYVVRKGFQVALPVLVRNPEKAAKMVAYIHPSNASATKAADDCLGLS